MSEGGWAWSEAVIDDMSETPRDWIFTFGCGHYRDTGEPLGRRFVRIHGTYAGARAKMVSVFGVKWSHQYESEEAAGVAEYGYTELALPEPRETDYEALGYPETTVRRASVEDIAVALAASYSRALSSVVVVWMAGDKE